MPTVLLYNVQDPARRMAVKLCLHRLGLRCRAVAPEEQGHPLGLLLGLEGYAPGKAAETFTEEMLVMHQLSSTQFSALLDALRRENLRIALKAVVTDTNIAWSSARLHRELQAEHAAMQRRGAPVHRKK